MAGRLVVRRAVATKHWNVLISRLGASGSLYEGTVDAPTWLAALQVVRKELGETGGVPAGASCNVSPNGVVMIQDARARRRYRLTPATVPKPPPGTKRPVASRPEFEAVAPAAARRAAVANPIPEPQQEPVAATPSTPVGRRSSVPPPPSSRPPADISSKMVLITKRDEEPTKESPIHFRERIFAVPMPIDAGAAEKLATGLLRDAQRELEGLKGAKFVRVELFDHVWKGKPTRAAVVRVEWKDWNKSIDIDFPLREGTREKTAASSIPVPATEDRLAAAFEACQDLLFLRNRAEALEFAVHLLEEVVPSEATAAFLLDINTDEFRLVAARGTGAHARKGQAFPSTAGLLSAASGLAEHAVLVLAQAQKDPRFREDVDGVPGLDVRALLYRPLVHRGRLFGLLQLANGVGHGMFTEADCEVVDYVTQQLSEFVARGATNSKVTG
ncbi:MAG: GAF domain-containing protein [Myxococcota bacterium]